MTGSAHAGMTFDHSHRGQRRPLDGLPCRGVSAEHGCAPYDEGVLRHAMLLAISGLGGGNATKEMLNANILASDTYAFYQAKNIRQTSKQLAADDLEALLITQSTLPADVRTQLQDRAGATKPPSHAMRVSHPPAKGSSSSCKRRRPNEQRRDRAARQDPNVDFAQALYQISIVLGSVSIVATSRRLLLLATGLGVLATLLMVNGFLLLVALPFG
jgi:hypothetical protein